MFMASNIGVNKPLKYTFKDFGILLGVLFLSYIIVFIYIYLLKKAIIKQVTLGRSGKLSGNVSLGCRLRTLGVFLNYLCCFIMFQLLIPCLHSTIIHSSRGEKFIQTKCINL